MPNRQLRALVGFALILTSCSLIRPFGPETQQTPESDPPQITQTSKLETSTPTTEALQRSVLVISWDGGRADLVYEMMAQGSLPNFAALAAQGVRAEYAQSVDPPLSAPAQNSIATGSYPLHTGILSNAFHNPNDSFYWYRRGLDEGLDQAEPVWVTASRAGLKTGCIFFAGCSPNLPGQTADYTIGYGVRDTYSRQVTVSLRSLGQEWQGEAPPSFSPPREGTFTIPEVARLYLYVVDSSDDQKTNYDKVILSTSHAFNPQNLHLEPSQWGSMILLPSIVAGADFLIQEIATGEEPDSYSLTLYYSGVHHNIAAPRPLLEALNQTFGFFPAGPDSYAIQHGWITAEENLQLLERYAHWMAEVTAWVYSAYQPDLLFTWQDGFDNAGHLHLMVDPQQVNYSPVAAEEQAGYFRYAAQIADGALGTMMEAVDLQRTTVLMVSDHGMAPLHTTVYVNTLLEQAGLLTLDRRNYVVVHESKAFAVASGGAANIYINLQGHEKNGFVTRQEYPEIQAQIIDLFSSLEDPRTGKKVFQRVLRQDELAALHLDHINAGDVFAQANPGYELNGWRGKDSAFEPAAYYGQHGYDSTLPEMHTLFIAAGNGITPSSTPTTPVCIVDYAPTIASWLGFPPAPTVDGAPIPALSGSQ